MLRERFAQFGFRRVERQISDIQILAHINPCEPFRLL